MIPRPAKSVNAMVIMNAIILINAWKAAVELEDLDLNAENLGLGQPAVSNALARMRKLFGDELFLRTSNGMEPTPFAAQLAGSVTAALGMIHGAINLKASFEAASSTRRFSVGMTDIGEIYFLPRLMKEMHRLAPSVTVSTVRNTSTRLKDDMEAGRIDLAIGLLPQLDKGFFQRRLFTQKYVCLFRKGHRLDKSILQSTDMVATVPERLAHSMVKPFNLVFVPHPVKLPQIAINLFWHARYQKDPANQWLRNLVFELHSG